MALTEQRMLISMIALLPLVSPFTVTPMHPRRAAVGLTYAQSPGFWRGDGVAGSRRRALPSITAKAESEGGGKSADDEDWRSFRAKLVAAEKGGARGADDEWAYDAGNLVEQGCVLMGGSELEYGFGLRQQYFHKCVLLILSHTSSFTRGVIVNRPTNRRTAKGWRIWYGGDVQGLSAAEKMQEAICLHKNSNPAVVAVSEPIIKGIYTCSLEEAEKLVDDGEAASEDFWPLIGYAGWAPGQLQMEIDMRSSWHVASASPVLLNDLITQAAAAQTAEAGISVWETLMGKIGLKHLADKAAGSFEDRMLREWARVHVTRDALTEQSEGMDSLLKAARRRQERGRSGTPPGMLLRTAPGAPFVLQQQYLHKALLLVLQDTDSMTVAVVLNRPTQRIAAFKSAGGSAGGGGVQERCVFFGGEYTAAGSDTRVMLLSASDTLREQGVGTEVREQAGEGGGGAGGGGDGGRKEADGVVISVCSGSEVVKAIDAGVVSAEDFLLVSGFCIWPKGAMAQLASDQLAWKSGAVAESGLQTEIDLGHMQEVRGLSRAVWAQLLALARPPRKDKERRGVDDAEHGRQLPGVEEWRATAHLTVEAGGAGDEGGGAGGGDGGEVEAAARSALADEALAQYAHFHLNKGGYV